VSSNPVRYARLQPGLLSKLKCQLRLAEPLLGVFEQMLLRVGVTAMRGNIQYPHSIPEDVDAVICDARSIERELNPQSGQLPSGQSQSGNPADGRVRVFAHAYPQGCPAAAMAGGNMTVMELAAPYLKSNLEPLLLRIALQKKLSSEIRGSVSPRW
jgi:hypothetical protein